jgi:cytochrome c oxidase assembly protein subunit 11
MSTPNPKSAPFLTRLLNRQMMGKLAVISVCMFGFGYAMVPIYKAICEATGVNSLFNKDKGNAEFAKNTQVDLTRKVVVDFDANSRGSWLFRPEKASMTVHPGELITVNYDLISTVDRGTIGQAIPSYAPQHSGQYFRKLECFCFKQQALGAQQVRRFPVVFVIDPKLPKDVTTITLSYTFFEIAGANASLSDASPVKVAQ